VHRYEHLRGAGEADTFWAGCGAVRRAVLRRLGGFDERRYPRPQIEDIELGYRIRALGHRIRLEPAIACTHLKRWTLRGMVVTDVRDRGVPWMELLLAGRGPAGGSLNVRGSERLHTALVGVAGAALLAAVAHDARWLLPGATALGVVVAGNAGLLRWLARHHGVGLALAGVPLRLLYYALNGVAVAWGVLRHARGAGPRTAPRRAAGAAARRRRAAPRER
jgi:hypothetical protein